MKKFFCVLISIVLCIGLVTGCGQKDIKSSSDVSDVTTSVYQSDIDPGSDSTSDETSSDGISSVGGTSGSQTSVVATTSQSKTSSTGSEVYKGNSMIFEMWYPQQGTISQPGVEYIWTDYRNSVSFNFYLDEYDGKNFKQIHKKTGLKSSSYKPSINYKNLGTYRWRVEGVSSDSKIQKPSNITQEGNLFMVVTDAKEHPANKGINYTFKNTISEEVLKNYLKRSVIFSFLRGDRASSNPADDERFIINTGAKYIGRAHCAWVASREEESKYPEVKETIERLHKLDPDIVFEACIFEVVYDQVNEIDIPDWVFTAFNLPVEDRTFNKNAMVHAESLGGLGVNTVPDMTKLEAQMWFYYRARQFIDLGFEGLHMGQVNLIGKNDKNFENWFKVCKMIRDYAKKNARRGMVLINAHTSGIRDSKKNLLFDFHSFPVRPYADPSEERRLPSADNPQRCTINPNGKDTIFKRSLGGITPSGWETNSLPYFVELDNFGGAFAVGIPGNEWQPWGFDDISWYANQPASYRHEWLEYAFNEVKKIDPHGAFEMPGSRAITLVTGGDLKNPKTKWTWYQANSKMFVPEAFGDEEAIKNIWIKDNKK